MSIGNIFEIGKRSLLSHQAAINLTAGNIANINKAGYIRRRVDLNALTAGLPQLGKMGLTLRGNEIVRVRQRLAENQLWLEYQDLGKYESSSTILSQLEEVFAEPTEAGLSNVLNEFWNAWNDLANEPESTANRAIVRDRAVVLGNTFNRIHSDYKSSQVQIQSEITDTVNSINHLLNQIGSINKQITQSNSMDLLDQRDQMITELSKQLNIKVVEKENGEVTISTDGLILVSGAQVNTLSASFSTEGDFSQVTISIDNINYEPNIRSGALAGIVEIHNEVIPDTMKKLDELARTLAARVNEVHRQGANLDDISGINFFAGDVTGADNFRLNEAIINDPGLIATKAVGEGNGSSSMALAIADLRMENFVGSLSPNDFYTSIMSQLGSVVQENDFLLESQTMIVQQLENQKQAISGVSLDEEMTRMMQYEQAYEAAAKVIDTVDGLVQTLLQMT